MRRPRLRAVTALTGGRLDLVFIDGSRHRLSIAHDIETLPGLAPLKGPKAFAGACIGEDQGWSVEWPALDIQIGADTLWMDAQAQAATDQHQAAFIRWRARNGLSLQTAAEALGVTPRTISAYGTGERPVPRYIALACKGWEATHAARPS